MALEALDQVIGIHYRLGDAAEYVRVGLNLSVKITRQVREVIKRTPDVLKNLSQICVHSCQRQVGSGKSAFQLMRNLRRQDPFAELAGMAQISRRSGQIGQSGPRIEPYQIEIGSQIGSI